LPADVLIFSGCSCCDEKIQSMGCVSGNSKVTSASVTSVTYFACQFLFKKNKLFKKYI